MRARDTQRVATLRLTLSAITNSEVAGDEARPLTDPEEEAVLSREVRRRDEAAKTYDSAGRAELAVAERAEGRIIAEYLPSQLDDDELAEIAAVAIRSVAEQTGSTPGRAQMGQVMKAATTAAAGRADGSRVAAAVRTALA